MLLVGRDADPLLVAKQEHLGEQFEALAHSELDPLVGYEIASFVAQSIRQRMSQREGQNSHSYISRLHPHVPRLLHRGHSPIAVFEATRAAKIGRSTPLQSHLARRAYGMGSIEIANLTTIGTARHELRPAMREGIHELAGHDVDFGLDSVYKMSYLGADTSHESRQRPKVLRIGYKSLFSVLDSPSELKGRTTAVIDVRDRSVYASDLLEYIQELDALDIPLGEIPEFVQIVRTLIDQTIPKSEILAMNETIYEVEESLVEKIQKRQHTKSDQAFGRKRNLEALYGSSVAHDAQYPVGDPRRVAIERYGK